MLFFDLVILREYAAPLVIVVSSNPSVKTFFIIIMYLQTFLYTENNIY